MTPKLKPCPFCGSSDIRVVVAVTGTQIYCHDCLASILRGPFAASGSLTEAEEKSKSNATEAWNRRVTANE